MSVLRCTDCGFDGARWSDGDIERTLAHANDLLGYVLEGADASVVSGVAATSIAPDDDPMARTHAVMHRVHDVAAARRAAHEFEPMVGRVDSLQASGGGVPKTTIPVAEIGPDGVFGDVQRNRKHHGRPWQAVCLYSSDLLATLRGEGHPIEAGATGENITISGIDWERMRGGLTVTIGGTTGDILMRTSSPAAPCTKIAHCFVDRHWNRIDHDARPGWARWYTSVLVGGTVAPDATVTITA